MRRLSRLLYSFDFSPLTRFPRSFLFLVSLAAQSQDTKATTVTRAGTPLSAPEPYVPPFFSLVLFFLKTQGLPHLLNTLQGHLAENHHEKHGRTHAQNAGLTGGLAAGSPGTTTTTTSTTVPRASVGDKISGKGAFSSLPS